MEGEGYMMIDEKATIGSILNAIREGNKADEVAKAIEGISQKPFLKALKDAGYAYNNKAPKGWHYIGDGEEPLNKSIFDYVNASSPRVMKGSEDVKSSSPNEVIKGNADVKVSSPKVHPKFTLDEFSEIREMLQEWKLKRGTVQEPTQVHERIKKLGEGSKTRKTIVIDKKIAKQLDDYCKSEKVNKSDIIHLALMDFFKGERLECESEKMI